MVEAMRVLWSASAPPYDGEIVKFPALRCDPKPVQKPGPKFLLGAHGDKGLERVARTYDGWMPLVDDVGRFAKDVAKLRDLMKRHGRKPDAIDISPLVDPTGFSHNELKAHRDAGANRLIVFSQQIVADNADGKALELARRYSQIVELARTI